jgi:hypothetical protein
MLKRPSLLCQVVALLFEFFPATTAFHPPKSHNFPLKHILLRSMSSTRSCYDEENNNDLPLPKLYSSIDEIKLHLRQHTNNGHHDSSIKVPIEESSSTITANENTKMPHLFLHFDVNETILLGDPAGGDSVHECINKIIAKSAFVSTIGMNDDEHTDTTTTTATKPTIKRSPSSGNICDTHEFEPKNWWNGMSIADDSSNNSPPPLYTGWEYPPNTCPYYRTKYKKSAKMFTSSSHGKVYRPLYDKLCMKIGLLDEEADMGVFQNFLPAFWKTLMHYFPSTKVVDESTSTLSSLSTESKRRTPPPPKVTLVLRTFGTDLPRVAKAISQFAIGNHPEYPNYYNEDLILEEDDLFCSGWKYITTNYGSSDTDKKELVYSLYRGTRANDDSDVNEGRQPAYSGDDDILNFLQSKHIVGIQDNYPFWRDNNHAPFAGKPVWTNTKVHGHDHHHVLLDDNIHNDPTDGAGGIRVPVVEDKRGGSESNTNSNSCYNRYESLHGEQALALHGRNLIRVPTIRPSLEDDWFIEQIEMARLRDLEHR